MFLLGTYYSPFKLNVSMAYDYNPSPTQSTIVTASDTGYTTWGGDSLWGSSTPWGGTNPVFEAQIFAQTGKCSAFQITIQESFDQSSGFIPGQGLALSGMNLVVGVKKGYRVQKASRQFG
jgi:hypothetical protein